MILALSCSSPLTSVALIAASGEVLFAGSKQTQQNASGTALELVQKGLQQTGAALDDVELFVADTGPGSFIGARVGVTLAKSLAFSCGKRVAGVSSFDLISPDRPVFVPSRRGEVFLRSPGQAPFRTNPENLGDSQEHGPALGYGPELAEPTYPNAANVASMLTTLEPLAPELLVPNYLIEPSISTPKPIGLGKA